MPNTERSLLRALCLPFLLEASQYAALAPLLPHYVATLHISHTAAGVLMSTYAAGVVAGALMGGAVLAPRIGVRLTVLLGILLLAAVNAAFAVAHSIAALDGIRFGQGAAGGCIWSGGLAWFIGASPPVRRGTVLGGVFSLAMLGTIVGPVIGTVALKLGVRTTFDLLALAALISAGLTSRASAPSHSSGEHSRSALRALSTPLVAIGIWLLLAEAAALGALYVLVPFRMAEMDTSGVTIGVTFTFASVLAALSTRLAGRLSDARGPWRPIAAALFTSALLLAGLCLALGPAMFAVLAVVCVGLSLVPIGVPACMLVARGAEHGGLSVGVVSMMITICFAAGEMAGGPAAAWLSEATSVSVPFVALALLEIATLALLLLAFRRSRA